MGNFFLLELYCVTESGHYCYFPWVIKGIERQPHNYRGVETKSVLKIRKVSESMINDDMQIKLVNLGKFERCELAQLESLTLS